MPKYTFYVWLKSCVPVTIEAESFAEAESVLNDDGMGGSEFEAAMREVVFDWNYVDVLRDGQEFHEEEGA